MRKSSTPKIPAPSSAAMACEATASARLLAAAESCAGVMVMWQMLSFCTVSTTGYGRTCWGDEVEDGTP